VQDVFTKLLETKARYDLAEQPEVLLFRMARNRCVDVRRKRVPEAVDQEPAARDQTPAIDAAADLSEALAALPDKEREVLLLTTIDGLGYREVAAILGCSLGTVAARKYAAIETLQRRLVR